MDIITHKSRELRHCPPHFITIDVEVRQKTFTTFNQPVDPLNNQDKIRNWLHENIENRFFIGLKISAQQGFMTEMFVVGFEDAGDASFFSLLLPTFKE